MMKHYGGVGLESSLPFKRSPRQPRTGLLNRVCRSAIFRRSVEGWRYSNVTKDALNLTVSKPVTLQGVQHFGSEGGKYKVSLEVKDTKSGFCLVKQTDKYSSEKDKTNVYYGFDVIFDHPVCLEQGKTYEIASVIKGPPSWYIINGKESVKAQGIQFSFSSSVDSVNGTNVNNGQFPALIFSTM